MDGPGFIQVGMNEKDVRITKGYTATITIIIKKNQEDMSMCSLSFQRKFWVMADLSSREDSLGD
jgi:hypothetical protein